MNLNLNLRNRLRIIANSIAFYPAALALSFLLLSYLSIQLDFSPLGKQLKSQFTWLSLHDASTARSIIATIVGGVISLTVFSFSLVMIVLNQAAAQMSNRVLEKLIGNRFQQLVLGIYIGTIVYGLFLLTTIRDIDSGIRVPAISTYLLILLTVFDIFIFIYFLHYITQSVKYEVIIGRISAATLKSMKQNCCLDNDSREGEPSNFKGDFTLSAARSGIFESVDTDALIALCTEKNCELQVLILPGTFVFEGNDLGQISKQLNKDENSAFAAAIFIHDTESIEENYFYGMMQLVEVALRALSPGINDPDTAVISLRALFQLYAQRIAASPQHIFKGKEEQQRLYLPVLSFEKVFHDTILPIWDYGKNDRIIQRNLLQLLTKFQARYKDSFSKDLLLKVQSFIQKSGY
ncbi:MAG: DUF2254 domain-containing protein [Chitinophagaceae bacterium]